nr:MAG TPA: hypothetical protein [Bacteriophage sp.]
MNRKIKRLYILPFYLFKLDIIVNIIKFFNLLSKFFSIIFRNKK